jgi:hypothetical protein
VTSLSLGGPGPGCSATRLRRLAAGELAGAERAQLLEHLAGCARCQETQREIAEEGRALAAALPFQEFASGVAERLARAEMPSRRWWARRWVPVAVAASLVAAAGVPLVARLSAPGSAHGVRVKGAPSLTVYVHRSGGARQLAPGESIPAGARLRLSLSPAGRAQAAVLLLDSDGAAVLYAGPALAGPLPEAFEWTGEGEATLLALFADEPIAAEALAKRVASPTEAAGASGAEVVKLKLTRRSSP